MSNSLHPMNCSTPGFPVLYCLPEFSQTRVHWVGDAIQPSHPLSSPSPPTFNLSQHQGLPMSWLFAWDGQSFSFSPSNEYSGLISFRITWFHIPAVQRTLKWLLQHHSSKVSVLRCSAFFTVQLSHLYMTAGKTIALTIQTFVGKVMSLNTLSRFVIAFPPKSKCLLTSWLQSPSTVILEPKKIKSVTASTFSQPIYHEVIGPYAIILVFWMLSFKPVFFTLLFHPHQEAL